MFGKINENLKEMLETLKATSEKMAAEFAVEPAADKVELTEEELAKKAPEKMDDETEVDAKAEDPDNDGDNDASASTDNDMDTLKNTVSGHADAISQLQASTDAITQALAEVKSMIQAISDATSGEAENFKAQFSELKELFAKIAGMPKEAPKTNINPVVINKREQAMQNLAESFARLR